MNIIESITKGYKKIFPTTWREREIRYGRYLEKVWGMPEGELERIGSLIITFLSLIWATLLFGWIFYQIFFPHTLWH